jgi:hypothetical protein
MATLTVTANWQNAYNAGRKRRRTLTKKAGTANVPDEQTLTAEADDKRWTAGTR